MAEGDNLEGKKLLSADEEQWIMSGTIKKLLPGAWAS